MKEIPEATGCGSNFSNNNNNNVGTCIAVIVRTLKPSGKTAAVSKNIAVNIRIRTVWFLSSGRIVAKMNLLYIAVKMWPKQYF